MRDWIVVLVGLTIASILYAPIGHYAFGVPLTTIFERAYFVLGGAVAALYATRS